MTTTNIKRSDLSAIMSQAWQFFRQTGRAFAECLKKAWAIFKLKIKMQNHVVEFHFVKLNGEIRQAFGRLFDLPETKGSERKRNDNLFTYFDTVVKILDKIFNRKNIPLFHQDGDTLIVRLDNIRQEEDKQTFSYFINCRLKLQITNF